MSWEVVEVEVEEDGGGRGRNLGDASLDET